jgi:hypothetical protein
MIHAIVNSTGLLLGFSGTILIWRFGLPQSVSRSGMTFLAIEELDTDEIKKARKFDRLSNLGICLIASSYLLQFLGLVLG